MSCASLPPLRSTLVVIIGFFMLTFAIYAAALHNNFVAWDDTTLILFQPVVRGLSLHNIRLAFSMFDPELYIPVTFMSYQLDFAMAGLNPMIFHTHNLILHTLNALLVSWLVLQLTGKRAVALVVGLLFAVHPLHAEAVLWASARKDVLSAFYTLLCTISYIQYRNRYDRRWYYASIALFAMALMAKVVVVALPMVLLIIDLQRDRERNRTMLMDKLPYAALSLLFFVVATFAKRDQLAQTTLLDKVLMAGKSTVFSLEKIVLPIKLSVIYQFTGSISLLSPTFYAPLIILSLLLVMVIVTSVRYTRWIAFGSAWFILFLAPTFVNFSKGGSLYFSSDRYAYLPSIGILLLAVLLAEQLWNRLLLRVSLRSARVMSGILLLALLVTLSFQSHRQTAYWKDSATLFAHTTDLYPTSPTAWFNLGVVSQEKGALDASLAALHRALALHDVALEPKIFTGIGNAYQRQGKTNEAVRSYREALVLQPLYADPHYGIAVILEQQGKSAAAIDEYQRALNIDPQYPAVLVNLGTIALKSDDLVTAERYYHQALTINPTDADAWYNLGLLNERKNDLAQAMRMFRRAVDAKPTDLEALVSLADAQIRMQQIDAALQTLNAIGKIDPKNADARDMVDALIQQGVLEK